MEPVEGQAPRTVRLTLVAVALLALLAVVAFASRSGLGRQSQAAPTPRYVSYAFTLFLIVFVLAIPIAAYAFLIQAREGDVQRKTFKSRVISNFATLAFFSVLAFMVLYVKRHHGTLLKVDGSALDRSRNALRGNRRRQVSARYEPQFEWPVFWVAVAVLTAAAAATVIVHRRRERRVAALPAGDAGMADELVDSLSSAIDDLEAEQDARRAVIAAYARMEGVLARHGLPRTPSETPLEYLARILHGLTSRRAAVERLTRHFERAKFSRREVDFATKSDAIAALREIRDDIEAGP